MKNKKYLIIGLVCVLVVAAVLIGVLVFGGSKDPQPTEPSEPTVSTTETAQPGGETEGTWATEGTEPDGTEGTEPNNETEETQDGSATEGTEPEETEPRETEPMATEPAETEGTEPDVTEPVQTEPPATEPEETEPEETEPEETKFVWDGTGGTHEETKPSDDSSSTDPTEHKHNSVRTWVDATCEKGGYYHFECACGHYLDDFREDALGHNWSEWEILEEPTVASDGKKTCFCSRCQMVIYEMIPALDPETGLPQESYVDPRIDVMDANGRLRYAYGSIAVVDTRTWGGFLSIYVNDDGTLTAIFAQLDGTRVEILLEVPPDTYANLLSLSDGEYNVYLVAPFV